MVMVIVMVMVMVVVMVMVMVRVRVMVVVAVMFTVVVMVLLRSCIKETARRVARCVAENQFAGAAPAGKPTSIPLNQKT